MHLVKISGEHFCAFLCLVWRRFVRWKPNRTKNIKYQRRFSQFGCSVGVVSCVDGSNINCLIKIFTFLMSVKGMCSFIYLRRSAANWVFLMVRSCTWRALWLYWRGRFAVCTFKRTTVDWKAVLVILLGDTRTDASFHQSALIFI